MANKAFETPTNIYTEDDVIGQGGAGIVYRVHDDDGQPFALKCLNATGLVKRRRFRNELAYCQQDQHANIIRIVDSGVLFGGKEPVPFYVMPIYDCTLRTLINNGIEPDRVLPLFDQVMSGVQAAHLKGVIHRDLKPENILYDRAADRLIVADFGIAQFEEDELLTAVETRDQERLANFTYAAPEQRVRGAGVDHRADIFALGLILNKIFTHSVPLAAGHPLIAVVAPQYAYLDELVERMILHAPADRPQSLGKVKEDLLARRNYFVVLQRLDTARRAVVPEFDPDDPLQGQEVHITGDFDYEGNFLKVGLEPTPPQAWWQAMGQIGDHSFVFGGARPQNVGFANGKALIPATPESVDQVFRLFQQWVATTNRKYRQNLQDEAARKKQILLQELERERKAEEERAQVLEKLRRIPLA